VGHWTLDNAANNGTFLKELEVLLRSKGIDFDHLDRRIMCFPHVVNICCQHVISDFTNIELSETAEDFVAALPAAIPQRQSYEDAVKRDPVALGRNIVRVMRASGQRRKALQDTIRDGNAKGWFRAEGNISEIIQLRSVELLRDVKTRWDSIYFMIKRLREMRPVSRLLL
jgi:hypothetical protein